MACLIPILDEVVSRNDRGLVRRSRACRCRFACWMRSVPSGLPSRRENHLGNDSGHPCRVGTIWSNEPVVIRSYGSANVVYGSGTCILWLIESDWGTFHKPVRGGRGGAARSPAATLFPPGLGRGLLGKPHPLQLFVRLGYCSRVVRGLRSS